MILHDEIFRELKFLTTDFQRVLIQTSQNWTNDVRSKLAEECALENNVRSSRRNSRPNFIFL